MPSTGLEDKTRDSSECRSRGRARGQEKNVRPLSSLCFAFRFDFGPFWTCTGRRPLSNRLVLIVAIRAIAGGTCFKSLVDLASASRAETCALLVRSGRSTA